MKILEEKNVLGNYKIEDLYGMIGTTEEVVCTVLKYYPDEGFHVDLGNNIQGYLKLSDFSDDAEVSKTTILSKIGTNIRVYIDDIKDNVVYVNRVRLQNEYKKNVLSKLEIGTIFDTTVLSVAPFGVFVNMGKDILGLLPIGDVSIARFSNIKEVFKKGDTIKVIYKGMTKGGYVVSHKELLGTWEENLNDFRIGEYCQGIVRELKPYGVFIELAPNLTGLAELPENYDIHLGDSVCIQLKSINKEKLKVKLYIVSISDTPYKVKYNYKVSEGVMKSWNYTPSESIKQINTVFDGIINI